MARLKSPRPVRVRISNSLAADLRHTRHGLGLKCNEQVLQRAGKFFDQAVDWSQKGPGGQRALRVIAEDGRENWIPI